MVAHDNTYQMHHHGEKLWPRSQKRKIRRAHLLFPFLAPLFSSFVLYIHNWKRDEDLTCWEVAHRHTLPFKFFCASRLLFCIYFVGVCQQKVSLNLATIPAVWMNRDERCFGTHLFFCVRQFFFWIYLHSGVWIHVNIHYRLSWIMKMFWFPSLRRCITRFHKWDAALSAIHFCVLFEAKHFWKHWRQIRFKTNLNVWDRQWFLSCCVFCKSFAPAYISSSIQVKWISEHFFTPTNWKVVPLRIKYWCLLIMTSLNIYSSLVLIAVSLHNSGFAGS